MNILYGTLVDMQFDEFLVTPFFKQALADVAEETRLTIEKIERLKREREARAKTTWPS